MNHYDIIIAGAGAAGLSLAYQLINSPLRERSILLIEIASGNPPVYGWEE